MSTAYVDCPTTVTETEDAELDLDAFGLDQLTRHFRVRTDYLPAELKGFFARKKDYQFDSLYLAKWPTKIGGAFADITAVYKGKLDGKRPEPIFSGQLVKQQVTMNGSESEAGAKLSLNLWYLAPTTTIKYATQKEPTIAKYPNKMLVFLDAYKVLQQRGDTGKTISVTSDSSSASSTKQFNIVKEVIHFFRKEQVGQWWEVEEVNQGQFVEGGLKRIFSG